jgi:hypothetical protein
MVLGHHKSAVERPIATPTWSWDTDLGKYMTTRTTALMHSSIQPQSQTVYLPRWERWQAFVATLYRQNTDPLMETAPRNIKTRTIVAFAIHLTEKFRVSPTTVDQHLSAIAHHFRVLFADSTIFLDPAVRQAKSALHLRYRCSEVWTEAKATSRIPVSYDIITGVVGPTPLEDQDMDSQMTATALLSAFFMMLRISEYAVTKSKEDHTLRGGGVSFLLPTELTTPEPGSAAKATIVEDLVSAVDLHHFVSIQQVTQQNIMASKIHFPSRKNDTKRQGFTLYFQSQDLPSDSNRNLVLILAKWALRTRPTARLPFFSYTTGLTRTHLATDKMKKYLRSRAATIGVPSHIIPRLKTHGIRIGGATEYRNQGLDPNDIKNLGGWASLPVSLSYAWTGTGTFQRQARAMANTANSHSYSLKDTLSRLQR